MGVAIVFFVIALFLVVLAIVMLRGHGASLVAGYNTADPAEKARIDERKLLRYVAIILLLTAGACVAAGIGALLQKAALFVTGAVLLCVLPVAGVIFINTGGRIRRK